MKSLTKKQYELLESLKENKTLEWVKDDFHMGTARSLVKRGYASLGRIKEHGNNYRLTINKNN